MRVYYPPREAPKIREIFHYAFRAIYVAWRYVQYIKEQPTKSVRTFLWNNPMQLPERVDEESPVPTLSRLVDVFGTYSDNALQKAFTTLGKIGDYFISSDPLVISDRYPSTCPTALIKAPGDRTIYLCESFWTYYLKKVPSAARVILEVIGAQGVGLDKGFAERIARYAIVRYAKASTCLVPEADRPECTSPLPAEIWFQPSGTGKDECTDSELEELTNAFNRAFGWVNNGKWFLDQLNLLSPADRERMWNWGYLPPGSIQATTAHQDGGDTYAHFWSPSNWFGLYSESKFHQVQYIVSLIWQRFQTGTNANKPVRFVCRTHKDCWSLSPKHTSSGWHNPASIGKIYLCKGAFEDNKLAETLLHEMFHFLVGDSALTNDPHDVVSKDACSTDARNACYGDERSRNLVSKSEGDALHNNDNYVGWLFWFNWFGVNRGCWPRKWIDYGMGAGQPQQWVGPP